jgi:hypothetical protein
MEDLASYPPSVYADFMGKYPHEPLVKQLKSVTANGDADFTLRPISVNGSPGTPANAREPPIETADTGISKKSGPFSGESMRPASATTVVSSIPLKGISSSLPSL